MKKESKEKILSASKTLLAIVGAVGFVFVAATASNAVQLLKYTPIMKRSRLRVFEINQAVKRLLERDLIEIKKDKNYEFLEVTEKGKKLLLKYKIEGLASNKPKNWDNKYRVVIFDISEQRRKTRDHLRNMLRSFGFVCLQGSVWVYPYHCQEIIDLLKQYLNLKNEVLYMTVESIEEDKWLKKEFKL